MGQRTGRFAAALLVLAGAAGAGGLAFRGGAAEPAGSGREGRTDRVQVPSRFDGTVMLYGAEVRAGEEVPPERLVTVRLGEDVKTYRRLEVGDAVEAGRVLARLDELLVRDELAQKKQKATAAEVDWKATVKARDEAEQRFRMLERLYNSGNHCGCMEELRGAFITRERYVAEEVSKKAAIDTAKLEAKSAELRLNLHAIRSPVRGTITKIYKYPGEAVRAYEPLVEVRIAPGRGE
jgi:biotin carboxyl carrier protein